MDKKQTIHKLKVDLRDIVEALQNNSWELEYYLDLETGQVTMISSEAGQELEAITLQLNDEDQQNPSAVKQAVEQSDQPDWVKEMMLEAYQVEEEFGDRYITIRYPDPYFGYSDMQDFIPTAENKNLRDKLWEAIQGKGAFRRFKDVLSHYPDERSRWFDYSDARMRERALEWLEEQGIELIQD